MSEKTAIYNTSKVNILRKETLQAFEFWEQPTVEELKYVKSILDLTGSEIANLVGMKTQAKAGRAKSSGSRTVRKWFESTGTEQEKTLSVIPYSAWAILCYEAGFGEIWKKTMVE